MGLEKLRIVAISDLHFGNPRIKPDLMYHRLETYFYPEVLQSHLVLLAGDTYDQLTTVSSSANKYVLRFIRDLFVMSEKYGIQIRILHGTYSHDRDQVAIFGALNNGNARAEIIDKIYCEELSDFKNTYNHTSVDGKLKLLYIPDNLSVRRSSEVMEQIEKMMKVVGWNTADIVLGHGTFAHALPVKEDHLPACSYTLDQFDSIVTPEDLIIMGHIHTSSRKENCYYCGSFDRMVHGEEEPKGFFTFTRENHNWIPKFVENKEATKFVSIYPQGDTPDEIIADYVKKVEENFPDKHGYVRVLHNSSDIRYLLHTLTVQNYPELKYSSKTLVDESLSIKTTDITLDTFDDVKPNVHNLGNLVYQYLSDKQLVDDSLKEEIVSKVHQIILK